ncbi:MAG: GNAT family N-acetyltransferase [Pseudomonadota bacterium]
MERVDQCTIVRVNDPKLWDRFVAASPVSHYCHLFNWGRIIQEVYHHEAVYLGAEDSGCSSPFRRLRGVFPLVRFRPALGKNRYISIPFFDQAGVLAGTPSIEAELLGKGLELAHGIGSILEIRQKTPTKINGSIPPVPAPSTVAEHKVNLSLPLGVSSEALLVSFKSKLRSQIRKGLKNGLTARIGKQELIRPFYRVFSRNMRDLGSPVHAIEFFNAIFEYFHARAFICIVNHGIEPVAAGFMFRFRDTLYNPWASSLRPFRHLNANMVLYWEMIRFSCRLGMAHFDMGRSTRGASTYWFKKQWSPTETPLYWNSWFPPGVLGNPEETLCIRPWKRLPLIAANALGPLVRRNISL